jgi:hypothetical protein
VGPLLTRNRECERRAWASISNGAQAAMLNTHWNAHEHQIQSLTLALRADLEDVSPADPLYGESVGLALGTYLIHRYLARNRADSDYRGGKLRCA